VVLLLYYSSESSNGTIAIINASKITTPNRIVQTLYFDGISSGTDKTQIVPSADPLTTQLAELVKSREVTGNE
jgi:hypothetical protein